MTQLFLVFVGSDWQEKFERSVVTPVDLTTGSVPDEFSGWDEGRIWGTTPSDRIKRKAFDRMETGDILLFFEDQDTVTYGGRVGQKFRNEEIGDWLWDTPESELIFTVEELVQFELPAKRLWKDLDYKPTYRLTKSLNPVNEERLEYLREKYGSVEAAYETYRGIHGTNTYADFQDDLAVPVEEISILEEDLYFQDWTRLKSRIEQALSNHKHVLLFGPPGTGKTRLATTVCEHIVSDEGYEMVTASADWSTFDTVGGYRSTAAGNLEFEPGVILDRFQQDDSDRPANEWLVIDEINRADIDKAFGSMFTALTGESVTLPFEHAETGEPIQLLGESDSDQEVKPSRYYIPEDWRMIATMNTLDKTSLYEMSYAFMRRWAFIPVGIPDLPDPDEETPALVELVEQYVEIWDDVDESSLTEDHYEQIGRIWYAVNKQRSIGPAIIHDLSKSLSTDPRSASHQIISAIIMYVYPQFEGLRKSDLESVIDELTTIVDESDELWTVAEEFFEISLQRQEQRDR